MITFSYLGLEMRMEKMKTTPTPTDFYINLFGFYLIYIKSPS